MSDSVIRCTHECFRLCRMPHSMNITFLVLVPTTFNHFRPINLCNFVYKVVSKILTERMRSLLSKIVSPNQ